MTQTETRRVDRRRSIDPNPRGKHRRDNYSNDAFSSLVHCLPILMRPVTLTDISDATALPWQLPQPMLRMRTMSHIGTGGWVCLHPGTPEEDTQRYAWSHSRGLFSSLRSGKDRVESAKPHLGHRLGHPKQTPPEAGLTKEQY